MTLCLLRYVSGASLLTKSQQEQAQPGRCVVGHPGTHWEWLYWDVAFYFRRRRAACACAHFHSRLARRGRLRAHWPLAPPYINPPMTSLGASFLCQHTSKISGRLLHFPIPSANHAATSSVSHARHPQISQSTDTKSFVVFFHHFWGSEL